MHKPPSSSKQGGFFANISLSKKWQKRWVWTTETSLHYSSRQPLTTRNSTAEINSVPFLTVLEARKVDVPFMCSKGCPTEMSVYGWILRTETKDILWSAPDNDTRERFVNFFTKFRQWVRMGSPEQDIDAIDFLRNQLVPQGGLDGPFNSETASSRLDAESTVAGDELLQDDDDPFRYSDIDEAEDQVSAAPSPSSSTTVAKPPARARASTTVGSRQVPAARINRPVRKNESFDDWDVVEGSNSKGGSASLSRENLFALSKQEERKRGGVSLDDTTVSSRSSVGITDSSGNRTSVSSAKKSNAVSFGETRAALEAKIEDRKRRAREAARSGNGLGLAIASMNLANSDSASPSPRAFALLAARRHAMELFPVATAACAEANMTPLKFPLEAIGQISTLLESVVFEDRVNTTVTGSSLGTTEGLAIRCAGDIDPNRFAKCANLLKRAEYLHPRGHEPTQVVVEGNDGTCLVFSCEFGAYVAVQSLTDSSNPFHLLH